MKPRVTFGGWLGYLAAGVVGGLVGALIAPPGAAPRAAAPARSPSVVTTSSSDDAALAALQRRVAALERSTDSPAQLSAPPPDAPAPERIGALTQEDIEERREARAEALQSAFDREARDPAWAKASERALADKFGEAGVAVTSFECGRTLCRGQVAFADPAARQLAQLEVTEQLSGFSTMAFMSDADGKHTNIYAARQGFELPRAD
jgi:hypothetical protein